MQSKPVLWLAALCLTLCGTACRRTAHTATDEAVRQMNRRAYEQRYRNVAETERLAQQVLDSTGGDDEMALLNLAFVAYQRMDYEGTEYLLGKLRQSTHNQVYLLCADVLTMKAVQRTDQYAIFFQSMHDARQRMRRIQGELGDLDADEHRMYMYACSEFCIIASTYYYYRGDDSLFVAHIRELEQNYLSVNDTAQWVYYNYMMGTGGLVVDSTREAVTLREFDHLMRTYNQSHSYGYLYFEGNALQALSQMAADHYDLIAGYRPEELLLLETRFKSRGADSLSLTLCGEAIDRFRRYKDVFQTACCHRTMGELLFDQGRYGEAIDQYAIALQNINYHHVTYYHATDTLLLYDTLQYDQSTEARWLQDDGVLTVPEWIGGIRQQLSKAYSALGMKWASDYNRNAYLDIQMLSNRNRELEQRGRELQRESLQLNIRAIASLVLFLLLAWLLFVYRRRASHRVFSLTRQLQDIQSGRQKPEAVALLDEKLEELEEQLDVTQLELEKSKRQNVVSRARVSLVHAIVPYLDRIAGEVVRMKREGRVRPERRDYILELVAQISQLNDVLTEWIKMRQGQLALNIRTVDLQNLFQIVGEGSYAFEQKGVRLYVQPTTLQVKADEALTLFMINTLADNARKFTPQGGSVTITAREGDDYVEVNVSDTGVGLSEDDLKTLNNNGVYDPATLGKGESDQKGFGFGLANCRGIIEKYKKQSDLFRPCLFGVSNNATRGCTFFFRLPRVLTLLCAVLLVELRAEAHAATLSAEDLYDSVYQCNIEGRYAEAVEYGHQALACDSADDQLRLGISNEMALSALALNDWRLYEHYDSLYTRLQKKLNQDPSLPLYVQRMESYHQNGRLLLLLLVLMLVALLWLIYRLAVNRRLEAGDAVEQKIRQTIDQQVADRQERIDQVADRRQRNAFEQNRIYVQNQVLSNCLSTIKHESMYYPSRIETLARQMSDADILRLDETVSYYRHIYEILCRQADDQVAQPGFKREQIAAASITDNMGRALQRQGISMKSVETEAPLAVLGDTILLDFLCQQMAEGLKTLGASHCRMHVEEAEAFALFALTVEDVMQTDEQLAQMFNPSADRLPFYVVRQIVREHDNYSGNRGLRLLAMPTEGGFQIVFTLLKSKTT